MSQLSVLVADDDDKTRELVCVNLTLQDYLVNEVADGLQAVAFLERETPDLVILDLMMPGMNGIEVCEWIRRRRMDTPILVLSAHNQEDLKVRALDAGADDYITKPFKREEFFARLRALMRRGGIGETSPVGEKVQIAGLMIDPKARRTFVDDVDMHLTRTEFALLLTLAQNRDAVLSHEELLAKVWGEEYRGSNHYLHVYLGRIRKKLGDKYNSLLETVAGIGYILHSSLQG